MLTVDGDPEFTDATKGDLTENVVGIGGTETGSFQAKTEARRGNERSVFVLCVGSLESSGSVSTVENSQFAVESTLCNGSSVYSCSGVPWEMALESASAPVVVVVDVFVWVVVSFKGGIDVSLGIYLEKKPPLLILQKRSFIIVF